MALTPFNDNIQINAPKSLDNKYTKFVGGLGVPHTDVAEANSRVNPAYRSRGLTQLINLGGIATEYWYRDGVADGDLIPKLGTSLRFGVAGEDFTTATNRQFNLTGNTIFRFKGDDRSGNVNQYSYLDISNNYFDSYLNFDVTAKKTSEIYQFVGATPRETETYLHAYGDPTNTAIGAYIDLRGNGELNLYTYDRPKFINYGIGNKGGTATYGAGFDSTGKLIEIALGGGGGGTYTVDNGLTASTATNFQLGGALVQNTTITAAATGFTFGVSAIDTAPTGKATQLVVRNADIIASSAKQTSSAYSLVSFDTAELNATDTFGNSYVRVQPNYLQIASGLGFVNHNIEVYNTQIDLYQTGGTDLTLHISGLPTGVNTDQVLVIDGTNRIKKVAFPTGGGGGGLLTADNGLTANTATNVRLGGTLVQDTLITTGNYHLRIQNNNTFYALEVNNTGGTAIYGSGSAGYGGVIGEGFGNYSIGVQGTSTATNSVGVRAIGEKGVYSDALTSAGLALYTGLGKVQFLQYGSPVTAGTAVYSLNVDAAGNVITGAIGGGGGGLTTADNGLTANTSSNVQLGGTLLHNTVVNCATFGMTFSNCDDFTVYTSTLAGHHAGLVLLNNQALAELFTDTSSLDLTNTAFDIAFGNPSFTKLHLANTGSLQLNAYGSGTFTGTATKWLAVDNVGNVIEQAPPAGGGGLTAITADNGLTATSISNVQLGGALLHNTALTAAYNLSIDDGTVSIGSPNDAGSFARLYVTRPTGSFGMAIYGEKSTDPASNDLGIGVRGDRNINSTSFSSASVQAGIYGELGMRNAAGFTFSGGQFVNISGLVGVFTMYTNTGNLVSGNSIFSGGAYYANFAGTGNVDRVTALRVQYPQNTPTYAAYSGTVTNLYGLYIDDYSSSTLVGQITNRWGIYQSGSLEKNYIGGDQYYNKIKPGAGTYMLTVDSTGLVGSQIISGGGSGVTTLSAIGATPNANAGTITGTTLNLEPASTSFGGVVTTAAQTFAGLKTFINQANVGGALQVYHVPTSGAAINAGLNYSGGNLNGQLDIYYNSFTGSIYPTVLTANRSYVLPNQTGTIALTSDIPTALSGTYTPTLTNTTNITSSTAFVCQYMRVGNVVTVSGLVECSPTSASTVTILTMSLPITSSFTTSEQAGGTAFSRSISGPASGTNGAIYANASASTVSLNFYNTSNTIQDFRFSYTYQIL